MTYKQIGRAEHREISAHVLKALEQLGKDLGLKFTTTGGIIGAGTGMIKLNVAIHDTASGRDGQKVEFEKWARQMGIDPGLYGKTFFSRGTLYRVVGIAPSRPKFPFECERVHDKAPFKFTREGIASAIPTAKVA